jgi:hypothetical protein
MKSPTTAAAILAVIGLLSAGCGGPGPRGEKIPLKLNLAKGDKKTMTTDMDMTTYVTMGKQNMDMKMLMGMETGFDVKDVDNQGITTIEMTNKRMHMNMNGGPVNMSYDSAKAEDAEGPIGQVMGNTIGKPLTFKINATGKSVDEAGMKQMLEDMKAKATPAQAVQLDQQFDGMKDSLSQMTAALPDHPVDIGDSWKTQFKMATDPTQPMTVDATYTLADRRDGVAYIDVDGTMKSPQGLGGTYKGQLQIDEKTGWTKRGDIKLAMSGKAAGADMSMEGTVTSKSQ